MNPEIKNKWVEELRSGKWKQGTGKLKQTNHNLEQRHCCLGVLCEIVKDQVKGHWQGDLFVVPEQYSAGPHMFASATTVPVAIRSFLGLNIQTIEYLIQMNDEQYYSEAGFTFKEIADFIEKTL